MGADAIAGDVFTDWWQIALYRLEMGDLPLVDDERMPKPLPDLGPHTLVWREGDLIHCEVDWAALYADPEKPL